MTATTATAGRCAGLDRGPARSAKASTTPTGEVWLQTYPRVLGFTFKPVSFWYATALDGTLRAVVAEVNNTFGERHCYLLAAAELAWGRDAAARPRSSTSRPSAATSRATTASASCARRRAGTARPRGPGTTTPPASRCCRPASAADLATAAQPRASACTPHARLLHMPLLALGVTAWSRIHWQALRLWWQARALSSASRMPPANFQPLTDDRVPDAPRNAAPSSETVPLDPHLLCVPVCRWGG